MKLLRFALIASVWIIGQPADGAPARFWISDRGENPIIGEAPTINATQGIARKLYIWGQPGTDANGNFRTLTDFSLNVVTLQAAPNVLEPTPFVDFIDGSFAVNNPVVVSGHKRFEYTFDAQTPSSQDGPLVSARNGGAITPSQPDAINGLKGLTIFSSTAVGVGNINDPGFNDPDHRLTSGGAHAWRIAEFSFVPLQSSGTNHLFLRIGAAGMRHQGDLLEQPPSTPACTLETCVVFGNSDANNPNLIYTAGSGTSHRQITRSDDTYDIRINAIAPIAGDFNGDGTIGPEDYPYWLGQYGSTVPPGTGADATGDGRIDALDYIFWRISMPPLGAGAVESTSPSSNAIPEPASVALAAACLVLLPCCAMRRRRFLSRN